MRFWYLSHLANISDPSIAHADAVDLAIIILILHLYIHTLSMQTVKALVSLHILVMHVTKIIFSFFTKLDMLITTIGIITIGTGMLGTIFGIEIVMIKNTSVSIQRTRYNTYINLSFLNFDHA